LFPWTATLKDRECAHLISAWSSGKLPRLAIHEAFPNIQICSVIVRKPEARTIGWSLDLQELIHVLSVVRLTKPRSILEIGTYDGFTALNLAANLEESARVYTVDLPQNQNKRAEISNACTFSIVGSKFRAEPESERIRQIWADSTKVDWTQFGAPFDMIFIDGCHDYRYVRSDSSNAIKHIRPGGTVFWHDYGQCVDVSRAVDELARLYPINAIRGTRLAYLRMPSFAQRSDLQIACDTRTGSPSPP
jgi:predicted O-methyltransferase YrrM